MFSALIQSLRLMIAAMSESDLNPAIIFRSFDVNTTQSLKFSPSRAVSWDCSWEFLWYHLQNWLICCCTPFSKCFRRYFAFGKDQLLLVPKGVDCPRELTKSGHTSASTWKNLRSTASTLSQMQPIALNKFFGFWRSAFRWQAAYLWFYNYTGLWTSKLSHLLSTINLCTYQKFHSQQSRFSQVFRQFSKWVR